MSFRLRLLFLRLLTDIGSPWRGYGCNIHNVDNEIGSVAISNREFSMGIIREELTCSTIYNVAIYFYNMLCNRFQIYD